MSKAARYSTILLIMLVYIFGSSGFVVHKCFSSKSFFVSNSILSAWSQLMFKDCVNQNFTQESSQDDDCSDDTVSIVQAKGNCSDFVYTLSGYEYQNQTSTDIPSSDVASPVFLAQDYCLLAENHQHQVFDTTHLLFRLRCSIDKLCILLI